MSGQVATNCRSSRCEFEPGYSFRGRLDELWKERPHFEAIGKFQRRSGGPVQRHGRPVRRRVSAQRRSGFAECSGHGHRWPFSISGMWIGAENEAPNATANSSRDCTPVSRRQGPIRRKCCHTIVRAVQAARLFRRELPREKRQKDPALKGSRSVRGRKRCKSMRQNPQNWSQDWKPCHFQNGIGISSFSDSSG